MIYERHVYCIIACHLIKIVTLNGLLDTIFNIKRTAAIHIFILQEAFRYAPIQATTIGANLKRVKSEVVKSSGKQCHENRSPFNVLSKLNEHDSNN